MKNLVKLVLAVAVLGLIAHAAPAVAKCGKVCQAGCERTAPGGRGLNVEECKRFWSVVNAKGHAFSARVAAGVCWTEELCRLKCRFLWRKWEMKSERECVTNTPCSQFPKSC